MNSGAFGCNAQWIKKLFEFKYWRIQTLAVSINLNHSTWNEGMNFIYSEQYLVGD